MACEYEMRVHVYHDGELAPAEREAVEQHVKGCAACARELDELRRMSRFLASARLPEIPSAALARLHRGKAVVLEPMLVHTSEFFAASAAALILVCAAWLLHAPAKQESVEGLVAPHQDAAVMADADDATSSDPAAHVSQLIIAQLP